MRHWRDLVRVVIDGRVIQDHFPGIARYTFNLIRALAAASPADEFLVLWTRDAQNTRYDLRELERCPGLELVEAAAPLFSLREQWLIPRQLLPLKASLIHVPYYIRPYVLPAPTVLTAYDLIPLRYPRYYSARERCAFRMAMGLSLATARLVCTVSHSTAADLQRYWRVPQDRLRVVPAAVDAAFSTRSPSAVAAVRLAYRLPERYVLYFGSNKPHKNLVRLVESWKRVAPRHPDVALVVAGHWEERYPQARARVAELGLEDRVIFLGPAPDAHLPALYSGAELFAFPSLYEGFGLPVLEAMACGAPVICLNTSSLPEVAGDAAILVDPSDADGLSEAILRALADGELRQELRRRGFAQAARFSWGEASRAMLAVYAEVS
jgi:alpha-1,3-rhamnosyl/mannosyltransferase